MIKSLITKVSYTKSKLSMNEELTLARYVEKFVYIPNILSVTPCRINASWQNVVYKCLTWTLDSVQHYISATVNKFD